MLSVKKIEAAKAKGKPYKLTDRDGLICMSPPPAHDPGAMTIGLRACARR